MRPGRAADVPGLIELWRAEVREGRRDSMPRDAQVKGMLGQFDWNARSRVEDGARGLVGAVLVNSRPSPLGTVAQIDSAMAGLEHALSMHELVRWGLQLSRAAGASAAQVWVGLGQGAALAELGLEMVRPWWRMDRSLAADLPVPVPVHGYELLDGSRVRPGSWAEMHNRSFADHWRFSPRSEQELMAGKSPQLCLMAIAAPSGQPAAVTLCQLVTYADDSRPQPVGLISSVGTVPEHRRQGLARWLVAEGLVRLREAGARHASLYVDRWNETRAFDAYGKLGFGLAFESEVWEATFP
ncbi:MAG: GNAT family N-acetyltransferase [Candidatus Dormibacteraceae bacterium]